MLYEYWLAALRGISDTKKYRLRKHFLNAQAIYNIEETQFVRSGILTQKEASLLCQAKMPLPTASYEEMLENQIAFIPYFSPDYPERLKTVRRAPYALYVKGKLPEEDGPSVAIVGARHCSPYGEKMALEYGRALAKAGVQVVSGMARGIDGAGQRGALDGGGNTFAVLGCGVDICYPRQHQGLYLDIQKEGGVISELPLHTRPLPFFFPVRNRIISGLSDYVLVMEAREKSGSLITADFAVEQGKDVYALPGPADSRLSFGCHRLIRQGAGILISPQDLLEEMKIAYVPAWQMEDKNKKELESGENLVYSCLDLFPKGIEELSRETKLGAPELMEKLVTLQLQGLVLEVSKNYYIKNQSGNI